MIPHLRVGERIVAIAAMEPRIAWCLPVTEAVEERLEGSVYAKHDILQDLSVDLGVVRHSHLDAGQLGLLLVGGDADATHRPRLTPFAICSVVDARRQSMRV